MCREGRVGTCHERWRDAARNRKQTPSPPPVTTRRLQHVSHLNSRASPLHRPPVGTSEARPDRQESGRIVSVITATRGRVRASPLSTVRVSAPGRVRGHMCGASPGRSLSPSFTAADRRACIMQPVGRSLDGRTDGPSGSVRPVSLVTWSRGQCSAGRSGATERGRPACLTAHVVTWSRGQCRPQRRDGAGASGLSHWSVQAAAAERSARKGVKV